MPKIDANFDQNLDLSAIEGGHDPVTSKVERPATPNETIPSAAPIKPITKILGRPFGKRAQKRLDEIKAGLAEEGKKFS